MGLNLTARIGSLAALIFLLACLALVFYRPAGLLRETRASWLLWAFIGWCLLSTLWSAAPGLTLRYGVQLGLTFAIAIAAAWRLSVTQLLRVLIATCLLTALMSLAMNRQTPGGDWVGVFGSKNAFAQFCTLCVISGLSVVIDPRGRGLWVGLGAVLLVLGLFLLVQAGSAGALIATLIAGMVMGGLRVMGRLSGWQRVVLVLGMALTALLAVLLVVGYFATFSRIFLDVTGKDVTLTGRTELWAIAMGEIAAHPLLGQGFKGFWVVGNPIAEALWEQFGIASKSGFHFHNTLISNAVEVGLVGVGLQIAIFLPTLVVLLRWGAASPSAETLLLAGLMTRQFTLMHSEVVFFSQFHVFSMLTVMAAVYATRAVADARRRAALPSFAARWRNRDVTPVRNAVEGV